MARMATHFWRLYAAASVTTMSLTELISVVREEFGRVAYSNKTHEKMLERLGRQLWRERWLNAALLTATAGGTVDVLVRDETESKVITLLLSAAALFLAIYSLSRN